MRHRLLPAQLGRVDNNLAKGNMIKQAVCQKEQAENDQHPSKVPQTWTVENHQREQFLSTIVPTNVLLIPICYSALTRTHSSRMRFILLLLLEACC